MQELMINSKIEKVQNDANKIKENGMKRKGSHHAAQLPITNFYALRALIAPSAFGTKTISENHYDIACGKS